MLRVDPFIESILYSFLQKPLTLLGAGCPPRLLIALLSIFLPFFFLFLLKLSTRRSNRISGLAVATKRRTNPFGV